MRSGDLVIGESGDRKKRSLKTGFVYSLMLAIALFGLTAFAHADDEDGGPTNAPAPDVARVSLIHGDVSMQRGDTGDWVAATINTPLVRGDEVATGDKSRAEVQLDYADILRLSSQSQAKIADLTRTRIQVQISAGYAYYSVFKGTEAESEIDTPNVSVRPLKPGRYRVQVNSENETDVIVRDGEAELSTPQGSTTLKKGERAVIRGTDNPEYKVEDAPPKDDWDRFNRDRDDTIRDAQNYRHTNPYYTGSQDLDAYGRWIYVPGYGNVWQPYDQPAAWAPYQVGRWVWEPYYGWTWVSYEPWGWAPYHYGRWFYWQTGWVWWPGPVVVGYRPLWSPAFVTFIGFGRGSSFAFGFGSIGWIPCGPFDNFYPWYGRGFNRVNVVNIVNVTNITNVNNRYYIRPLGVRGRQRYISNVDLAMRNPHVRGGISGVRAEDFGRGNMRVARLDLKDGDLRESRVVRGNLGVVPTRESLRPGRGDEPVRMSTRPATVDRFYTRRQPPAALPSFHDQVNRMQQVAAHTEPARVPMQGREGGQDRGFHTQPTIVNREGGANDRGFHTQPTIVNREGGANDRGFHTQPTMVNRDAGGNGGFHTQPGEVNRVDGGNRGSSADRPNREQNSGDRNGWHGFGNGNGGRQEASASGPQQQETGGGKPGPERNGNASPTPERNDHTGWTKFSPRPDRGNSGHGQQPASGNNDRGPRMDRSGQGQSPRQENGSSDYRTGYHRFPAGQDRSPQQDRSAQPSPNPRSNDNSGWQRFPANGDRGSRGNDSANRGNDRGNDRSGGKPRLDLDKPIVTPRTDRGSDRGPSRMPDVNDRRGNFPSQEPSRGPQIHDRPGNFPSPSPSRMPEIRGGGDRGGSRGMPSGGRGEGGGNRGGNDHSGGDKGSRGNSGPHYR